MSDFLLNPKQMHQGKRDETARLARLQAQIEALTTRVEALEAKRPVGRPPKEREAA